MEIFEKLKIINVGTKDFHESLKDQEADSVHVVWKPPAGGDQETAALLDELEDI